MNKESQVNQVGYERGFNAGERSRKFTLINLRLWAIRVRMDEFSKLRGKKSKISWSLKIGPIGYPETSVMNCHHILRNIPEERRYCV